MTGTADPLGRRLGACAVIAVLAFALLGVRVVQVQARDGDSYARRAVEQTLHRTDVPADRGSIFDRNGRDLALTVRRSTVYADPTLVRDPVGTAAVLAPVLGVDGPYLVRQLSDRRFRFRYLARTVSDDVQTAVRAAVRNHRLSGIGFMEEPDRSYPAGPLAAALLGRIGGDPPGSAVGIEGIYHDLLVGSPGRLEVEVDPGGKEIPGTRRVAIPARRGSDIVLTIDEDVQWQAEHALADQITATGARRGTAVVVDLADGDVLAMATVRSVGGRGSVAGPYERNVALTDLYEPGSTMKVVTLSWALEHGRVAPTTRFEVPDRYRVPGGDEPYEDAEPHPTTWWTTADIMRESSNVGTIKIAERMTNAEMGAGQRAFGLGRRTTIDWPGQSAGLLTDPDEYYATGRFSAAIGYGAAVSVAQMLGVFATVANGGVSRPLHLREATVDPDGRRTPAVVPAGRRVVSATTAAAMTTMMRRVVGAGTGACAAVPGYTVAGKTGTAKIAVDGEYTNRKVVSFIGFAPAERPRFAVAVVVDSPADPHLTGGTVAAPVWSEITRFALLRAGVAPNDPNDDQFAAAQRRAVGKGVRCEVPHGPALDAIIGARVAADPRATARSVATGRAASLGRVPSPSR
ncbi:MAG: peptidoglycan D,D-transpeptidase FtsI family protein [Actinomycetota bacterium]